MILNILGVCSWILLFICSYSLVLCSAGSGVNSVQVVLTGLSIRLLPFVHVCIGCRYGCRHTLTAFLHVYVDVMVM